MNLLLLFETDRISAESFRVTGPRAQHLRRVLDVAVEDTVRVGLLDGPFGEGRVEEVSDAVTLSCTFSKAPPRPIVDLILAVPRPKILKKLLPVVASLGVDRLVLLRTWRVQKPYLAATILEPTNYRPLLFEGMMQGCTTREPELIVEPLFKPFVEDRAEEMFGGLRLVAHPREERRLASIPITKEERVALVVGPEGGLIPYEVDLLRSSGFTPVSMGEQILRVDVACIALLSQLDVLRQVGSLTPEPLCEKSARVLRPPSRP